ncbi:hypothetical protein Tco_1255481 [Tanacetum coccineum]
MAPRVVLMKSDLVSVNTARQVNTAHSKTTVNAARPMSYLSKITHSAVKRPIHKNTTFKNSNINQRVNTVRDKKFNTARPKAVVNVVKGNNFNAVKASACKESSSKAFGDQQVDTQSCCFENFDLRKNGNSWVPIPVTTPSETGTSTATKMIVPSTIEEKMCKKNDSMFVAIKAQFGGNEATKKTQKALLKQQLQRLVSRLAILGVVTPLEDLNVKFLRSLPSEWDTHEIVWMNKPDLDTMGLDDLYNNFKIVEKKVMKSVGASNDDKNLAFVTTSGASNTNNINTINPEVSTATTKVNTASTKISTASFSDVTLYAFLSTQPKGSQLVHEDLEQLHDDDFKHIQPISKTLMNGYVTLVEGAYGAELPAKRASYLVMLRTRSVADAQIQDKDGLHNGNDAIEKSHDDSSLKDNGTAINTARQEINTGSREVITAIILNLTSQVISAMLSLRSQKSIFHLSNNFGELLKLLQHNVADLLTKGFDAGRFQYLVSSIGMLNP